VILVLQAQAFAALGRVEELNQLLDEVETTADLRGIRYTQVEAAEALRATGHVEAARQVADRAIHWFEARPPDEADDVNHQYWYGMALVEAGRSEEAQGIFDGFVTDPPGPSVPDGGIDLRAYRAFIAASCGDTTQALSDLEWFEATEGDWSLERGIVAGALGDLEGAVELIRDGSRRRPGSVFDWWSRTLILYEPLRDYPPFQVLIRPKR
jgi:hypothetical protein